MTDTKEKEKEVKEGKEERELEQREIVDEKKEEEEQREELKKLFRPSIKSRIIKFKKPKKEIKWDYNNKTRLSYLDKGLEPPARLDEEIRHFLSKVDTSTSPIKRTVTRIIRLKAPDYSDPKKTLKEYIYWYENWYGKDFNGVTVPPVTDHLQGKYYEQEMEPIVERNQVVGEQRSGEHEVYYLPFSKEAVDKIIESSVGSYKENIKYVVSAEGRRNDSYSYDQFVNSTFEQCVELMCSDGGPNMYQYYKDKKDKQFRQQNKQYS